MLTRQQLETDLKAAMRAGDEVRKRTLRMLLTSIKLAEVAAQAELDEPALFSLIAKEMKTRQESVEEAAKYDRQDLAQATQAEIEVLQSYLPPPLSDDDLQALVKEAIAQAGATSPSEMGAVMKVLMPKLQGRADGKTASNMVRELLSS